MKITLNRIAVLLCLVGALVAVIVGCGGGGGGGGGTSGGGPGVVINSPATNLAFNQTINLTASVPGQSDQTVIFSADGGTLQQTGPNTATYTAPGVAGIYHINARADVNSQLVGSVTITVSATSVTISPTSATLKPGQTTTFSAKVTGSNNTNVTFTASGGTITKLSATSASYKAPLTSGTYTVTATAAANTGLKAHATVTVTQGGGGGTATVTGKVLEDTGTGLRGIVVQFFDVNTNQVAQTTTGAGGVFTANVPTTARKFNLLSSSIGPNDYAAFTYRVKHYSALENTCSAPLPALASGATVALPGTIVVPNTQGPPPPPPDGCG
jgi:hypothetical protein